MGWFHMPFNEELGDKETDAPNVSGTTWKGYESSEKQFTIPSLANENGYILVTVAGVNTEGHKVLINGHEYLLPNNNIASWNTVLVKIQNLSQGANTIQFINKSGSDDNGAIKNLVVHWHD